jgi:hypothetical protein
MQNCALKHWYNFETFIILEKVNPKIPPAKSDGAKTPPIPPEAVVRLLEIIFRNNTPIKNRIKTISLFRKNRRWYCS